MKILTCTESELFVELGHDAYARVHITRKVLGHSGALHIAAAAYQVDAQGVLCVDMDGLPIRSSFGHTMSAADSADAAAVAATIRSVVAVVAGEEPEIESWRDAIHADAHQNASLRRHMGARAHAAVALGSYFQQ